MHYRFATASDAEILAPLNLQLIHDEGHRNPMNVGQLAQRMSNWLLGEYEAVLFLEENSLVGYALFRREPEHVYLRQLFVAPELRRQGVGRAALQWLWQNAWQGVQRLRIEVLVENTVAREFWHSVDFREYCHHGSTGVPWLINEAGGMPVVVTATGQEHVLKPRLYDAHKESCRKLPENIGGGYECSMIVMITLKDDGRKPKRSGERVLVHWDAEEGEWASGRRKRNKK